MQDEGRNEALTGLEIIITIAFFCIFIWLCGSIIFNAVMPDIFSNNKTHGGLVGFAVGDEDNIMMIDGICYGAQNTGGVFEEVELQSKETTSLSLGSCTIPLSLLTGQQVSIDMGDAKILFMYNDVTEELSYSDKRPLLESSWTIAQKSNMIPLVSADSDIILEPNEIFTILVYPAANVPANEKFSVEVTPKSNNPLKINPTVPPQITSQRIVELFV
ncbi:MAG: hypothetical protein PHV39_04015 [Methanomicrobium sp.]|nr:hypothetical protein [Methanomicrobium sp.]